MKNYLTITVQGEDRTGLVANLTQIISEAGCAIVESRMAAMASEFGILMLIQGNWSTLAKLEAQLRRLEQNEHLSISVKRCDGQRRHGDVMPYAVEVIAPDQPGIVNGLAAFFAGRSINIEDLVCRRYQAPHTGTAMFSVNLVVGVPTTLHLAVLREEFMDYCDHLNLDAVLEPVKA